jgi:hypothetical protein
VKNSIPVPQKNILRETAIRWIKELEKQGTRKTDRQTVEAKLLCIIKKLSVKLRKTHRDKEVEAALYGEM